MKNQEQQAEFNALTEQAQDLYCIIEESNAFGTKRNHDDIIDAIVGFSKMKVFK